MSAQQRDTGLDASPPGALIQADDLARCVADLLTAVGFSVEDGAVIADALVAADLRGVASHGVSNMLRLYLDWVRTGVMNPRPNWRIVRELAGTANIDGDGGLGVGLAPRAMDIAVEKARRVGTGLVTMFHSHHVGMAAYHAMRALPHDMIGVCLTAVGALVAPTLGREQRLGTNPIAVAVPTGSEPPFVFDAATSVIPGNRVSLARRQGVPLPAGTIAAPDGTPIMERISAPGPYQGLLLLPLGSTSALGSHKGYGLAVIVDVLSSVLAGAGAAAFFPAGEASHLVMAINVEAFGDLSSFKEEMDRFLRWLKDTPPARGQERVLVAGELEWEAEQRHRAHGIPLHAEVAGWFQQTCGELGVAVPAALAAGPKRR